MPIQQNTGSFGSAIGGADALKEAMARRGIDASMLDQVSPAGGGTEVTSAIPQTNPQIGAVQQATQQPQTPFRSAEMEIASKALAGVVKTENKIVEQALKLQQPPQPMGGV